MTNLIQNFRPIPTITVANDYWENKKWRFNVPEITVGTGATPQPIVVTIKGIGALTLVNAIDEGLLSLKLFGGTEQRNIPTEYTQVEYIESSGTQYIDLGYLIDGTMSFSLKTRCLAPGFVFGNRFNNTTDISSLNYDAINNLFGIRMGNTIVYNSTNWTENTDYEIYISDGDTKINGTTVSTTAYGTSFYSGNAYLFTINNNGAPGSSSFSINRIYYFQMFKNGVLTQNLIPCKRNSDNVLGMYDTVTGTFLTNSGTGTFTAGADVVPTPDTPMDIVSNNGVLKVSPNLFTRAGETLDKFYNASGVEQSGVYSDYSFSHTDFIKVKPNTTYTLGLKTSYATGSGQLNHRVIGWTSSKSYVKEELIVIEPANTEAGTFLYDTFTTSATTEYVTINFVYTPLETEIQLVQGSSLPATYRPYGAIYTDGTQETVEIHSKNLFNYEYFYDNYKMYSPSSVGRCPIKLQPNTTYTVSTNTDRGSASASMFVVSGSAIDWTPNTANNGVTSNSPRIVTTDSEGYLCLGIYVLSDSAIPESDFINGNVWVQIEQGSSATTYENYFNGGFATAEMLLKVGNYKDIQSVLDGGVTRNVGVKVFDGTEDWYLAGSTVNLFNTPILDSNTSNEYIPYSTHFQGVLGSTAYGSMTNGEFKHNSNGNNWYFKNIDCSTADQFKQWLKDQYNSGNPVVVVYPLATATTETVTGQPLTIQAGTNIVEITQASMDNLGLEVSYKQTI